MMLIKLSKFAQYHFKIVDTIFNKINIAI